MEQLLNVGELLLFILGVAVLIIFKTSIKELLIAKLEDLIGSTDRKYLDLVIKLCEEGVLAAEQLFNDDENESKKDYVINYVIETAAKLFSLELNAEDIEVFIEAAVKELKNSFNGLLIENGTIEDSEVKRWDL